MKVKVDRDACIGCGACAAIAPKYFEMDGAKSKVIKEEVDKEDEEDVRRAADACPVDAITIEE